MPQAFAHRLTLRSENLPRRVPCRPAVRQSTVHHVAHCPGHVVSTRRKCCDPTIKAERQLAVDHPAQALAQLLQKLCTLNCDLEPRAEAARQAAVEQMPEALAHDRASGHPIRPLRMPGSPAASNMTILEVKERTRHVARTFGQAQRPISGLGPRDESERQLSIEHEAHALAKQLQERRTLLEHLHPNTPAA